MAQGLNQVVLLGPDQIEGREVVAGEHRVVVGDAEVTGPGEEPASHALSVAGVLPARRGELPDGFQHPVAGAGRGVDHLEQRLIGELLQDRHDVGAEQVPGGGGGEPA